MRFVKIFNYLAYYIHFQRWQYEITKYLSFVSKKIDKQPDANKENKVL